MANSNAFEFTATGSSAKKSDVFLIEKILTYSSQGLQASTEFLSKRQKSSTIFCVAQEHN
jgi:hypothetical protein